MLLRSEDQSNIQAYIMVYKREHLSTVYDVKRLKILVLVANLERPGFALQVE